MRESYVYGLNGHANAKVATPKHKTKQWVAHPDLCCEWANQKTVVSATLSWTEGQREQCGALPARFHLHVAGCCPEGQHEMERTNMLGPKA